MHPRHEGRWFVSVADIINHRCAEAQDEQGRWNRYTGRMAWDQRAITADNPEFGGQGNHGRVRITASTNIDHTQEWVRNDLKQWLHWMKNEIGFGGWRFDFVKGYGATSRVNTSDTDPFISVGEHWVSCNTAEAIWNTTRIRTGRAPRTGASLRGVTPRVSISPPRASYRRLFGTGSTGACRTVRTTPRVSAVYGRRTLSRFSRITTPDPRCNTGLSPPTASDKGTRTFLPNWNPYRVLRSLKDGALREDIERLIAIRKRNGIACNARCANGGRWSAAPVPGTVSRTCDEILCAPSICMKIGHGDWSNQNKVANTRWKCQAAATASRVRTAPRGE